MREVGVEFRDLAAGENEVLAAEDDAQPPVEDVQPVVSLVRARVRFKAGRACGQDVLEDLQSAGTCRRAMDLGGVVGARTGTMDTRGLPR